MRDATHYADAALRRDPPVIVSIGQVAAYAAAAYATVPLNPAAALGPDVLEVVANHGRWLVECPDCGGAQLAHPADPRFLCSDCGNAAAGGKFRRVVWPKNHAKIAEILDQRVDEVHRNWSPGESLNDLREENDLLAKGPVMLERPEWQNRKWAGHTHRYPKNPSEGDVCSECSHPFFPEQAEQ